mmetsp:Transcript_38956/g.57319  ORF Transcript_38956/g.57319 Transcript_38956/m.57319 type:complete len:81 (-) Transcript_38956:24-266(-)
MRKTEERTGRGMGEKQLRSIRKKDERQGEDIAGLGGIIPINNADAVLNGITSLMPSLAVPGSSNRPKATKVPANGKSSTH